MTPHDSEDSSVRENRRTRPGAVVDIGRGVVLLGGLATGFIALFIATVTFLVGDNSLKSFGAVEASVPLIAAAIIFGLMAVALFRRP